ncbi:hypothetical protein F2Q68_00026376 [Brassica cretica]|uniref:Uncharacterized protein n=1 Tax=Brassica cretica TaxID=69181 RepID=A0A8S9IHN3_BRACR|nr:hypothetical protein F2Q68_00026376 [Brassica cretica]
MAGGRSNTSGDSRGSSSGPRPENPYQRYLRCSFAAENKLQNDNHIFKWADEVLLNEVDTLLLIFCVFYSSRD